MTATPRKLPRLFVTYWWQLMLALGIPLAAAIAVEAYYGYRAQLEQVKRTQSVQSLALALAIESTLQREVRYVSRVYQVPWPGERLRRLAEELEVATSLFPSILQARIEREGRELLFVSQLEPRRIAAAPPQDAPAADASGSTTTFYAARIGPREIPAVVARIANARQRGESLEMAIDLRGISDLLAQAGERDGSVVYLIGSDNKVLAHSDPSLAHGALDFGQLQHVAIARADMAATQSGFAMESIDAGGRNVMATVRELPGTRWLIVMERPLAAATASMRAEAWRALLFLAIALIGATVLGGALAHRFTRPVLQLGSDVERIGRGELMHRASINTGDEVQRLGEQVNEMAARLEDYTASLEQMVQDKTAQLQAALKVAEDAVRTRAMFLAAASHDLRQPLYAISLLADAMSVEPLPPGVSDTLDKQRRAIASLRTLFDNLLDLSRFDAGEVRASPRSVPLREILWPIASEFEIVCKTKGLSWSWEVPGCWVRTDPELMRRVVQNLLSNAVRYTPAGGITLAAEIRDERVIVTIRDTGIGIAPENHSRVFEEFVQIDNPARDREKGVGLGLSIVRRISDLLGAHVTLSSSVGAGTTVSFEVPLVRVEQTVGPGRDNRVLPSDVAGLTAWAVEDDPAVRVALQKVFDAWRIHHAVVASRGELEGLVAAGTLPDLVLLDDMLGGAEGGLEIAQWLTSYLPAERVVLITGNVNESRIRALEASGFVVLRKPLATADLLQWMRDATVHPQGKATTIPA